MKYTKLFVVALVTVVLVACGAKEEKKEPKSNQENEEVVTSDENVNNYSEFINPADSSSSETMNYDNPVEEQVDPAVEEKPKVVEKPKKKKVKNTHQKRFYIVVGSFEKYDNAKKLKEYFQKKNYHPMILPKVNQYNRVALVSYVEEANARKAIKKLRIEHNDLTFWIYKW